MDDKLECAGCEKEIEINDPDYLCFCGQIFCSTECFELHLATSREYAEVK